jgi:AcrR family transcriptional regulator
MSTRTNIGARKPRSRYHHGSLRTAAVEAAARDIDVYGHVAFSLERVGKRLGVTPAALYRHFENRDALLREVMWQTFSRFVERMDAVALAPDSVAPIAAIGRTFVRFALENPGWFRLQFSIAGGALSDRQKETQPEYAAVLGRELARLFGDDPSAVEGWYLTLWAFIHGVASFAVEHILPPLRDDEERLALADRQIDTFLVGLQAASASTRARTR